MAAAFVEGLRVAGHRDMAGLAADLDLAIEVEMATGAAIEGAEIAENRIEVEMATGEVIEAAIAVAREDRVGQVDLAVDLGLEVRVVLAVSVEDLAAAISAVAAVGAAAAAAHRRVAATRQRRRPAIA